MWTWRRHIVLLVALVASATAERMAYAYWVHAPGKSVFSDMAVYNHVARNLQAWTLGPGDTFFPMGYPAFIAIAYAVSSHPLSLVALGQALAGGMTCLLTYLVARRTPLSPEWSLVAACLVALYPPFLFYGSMLLTESVSPLLFTLVIWLMLRAIDTRRWQWAAMLGVAFSVASLVRTNFLPFAAVIAACVWAGVDRQGKLAVKLVTVTAVAALPLLVWVCVITSTLTGRLSGPSTNGGVNFFMMQAEVAVVMYYDGGIGPTRNTGKYTGQFKAAAPLYEEPYYYREGMRLIRADPWRAVTRAADGVREALGLGLQTFWPASGDPHNRMSSSPIYRVLRKVLVVTARAFVFVLVLPPLVVILVLAARRTLFDPPNVIWLAVAGAFSTMLLTSMVFLADPRMHVPYDALLIVASVAAIQRGWASVRSTHTKAHG